MAIFKTLLVDDEALALERLARQLRPHANRVEVIDTAQDGAEAIGKIERLQPDLIFLDIHLGAMDGFQVLQSLKSPPLVIFTTAYDEYALKAFETHALDYLLKPIHPDRLAKALSKLDSMLGQADALQKALESLKSALPKPKPARVQVKLGDRFKLIDPADILYFQAGDKYVELVTAQQRYLISQSLNSLAEELAGHCFLRIHRSVLVNERYVDEIGKRLQGGHYVQLNDPEKTRLPLSRHARSQLSFS